MARILVMDDDPGILALVRETLEREGHEVVMALNGAEGVSQFKHQPTHLVITDIFMPETDGLEAIREILRFNPQARIIAMTGKGKEVGMDAFALNAAQKSGALAVLNKPFSINELTDTVAQTLLT